MKPMAFIICGLSLAALAGVFYFQIGSEPQMKSERDTKSAPQDLSQGGASEAGVYVDAGLRTLNRS